MFIHEITLGNFKLLRAPKTWTFKPGLNCIIGPNGVGKSTILDGIFFALFGNDARSIKNSIIPTDVTNLSKDALTRGQIYSKIKIESPQGKVYIIERRMSTSGSDLKSSLGLEGSKKYLTKEYEIHKLLETECLIKADNFLSSCYARQGSFSVKDNEAIKTFFSQVLELSKHGEASTYFSVIEDSAQKDEKTKRTDIQKTSNQLKVLDRRTIEAGLQGSIQSVTLIRKILPNLKHRIDQIDKMLSEAQGLKEKLEKANGIRTEQQSQLEKIMIEVKTQEEKRIRLEIIKEGNPATLLPKIQKDYQRFRDLDQSYTKLLEDLGKKEERKATLIQVRQERLKAVENAESFLMQLLGTLNGANTRIPLEEYHIRNTYSASSPLESFTGIKKKFEAWSLQISILLDDFTKKMLQNQISRETIEKLKKKIKSPANEKKKFEEISQNIQKSLKISTPDEISAFLSQDFDQAGMELHKREEEIANLLGDYGAKLDTTTIELGDLKEAYEKGECPTCKTNLTTGPNQDNIIAKIKKGEWQIVSIKKKREELEKKQLEIKANITISESQKKLAEQLRTAIDKIVAYKTSIEQFEIEIKEANDKLVDVPNTTPYSQSKTELDNSITTIRDLLKQINSIQLTRNEIEGYNSDIQAIDQAIIQIDPDTLRKSQSATKKSLEILGPAIKILETCVAADKQEAELMDRIKNMDKEIASLDKQLCKFDIQKLEREKKRKNREIGDYNRLEGHENSQITVWQNSLTGIENLEKSLKEQTAQLKYLENYHAVAKLSLDANDTFIKTRDNLKREEIGRSILDLLQKFELEHSFTEVQINQDFTITLYRDGVPISPGILSGGEEIAYTISVRMAVVQELREGDLLILDEPSQHLDDKNVPILFECLSSPDNIQQLIIVDHHTLFRDLPGNMIPV